MNQEKIGKLIAKLRKEKGLTQSDLGAKVGVGFKAVSKWERGITCPDISIINELSQILGITTDELLNGELNEEHKQTFCKNNHLNKKLLVIIISILLLIICTVFVSNYYKHRTYVYNLSSSNINEFYLEGKLTFQNDRMSIYINKLEFIDLDFNDTIIKNYQYKVIYNNEIIAQYGYIQFSESLDKEETIKEFLNNFNFNYNNIVKNSKNELPKENIILEITFLDKNENIIDKKIAISAIKK